MDANEPTVPVVFRKWSDGGIIALFPNLPGSPGYCSSYEHLGQHGSADYYYVLSRTTPAKPSEYAPLKRELESIGYTLRVVKRATSGMVREGLAL